LKPGDVVELLLEQGPWRCDLAALDKGGATLRLVALLGEDREPPAPIDIYFPLTAQLPLVDEILPPLVELGAGRLIPTVWERSEYDARKTQARLERWHRIIVGAAEQSHRSRLPVLAAPAPFEALLQCGCPQRWVAYEGPSARPNPALQEGPIALASGPEGGIAEAEVSRLLAAGWHSVGLGKTILRAVTAPVALLGAVRFLQGR
jgi:16S rRNA (uracil1498-N3)-methyltransferase